MKKTVIIIGLTICVFYSNHVSTQNDIGYKLGCLNYYTNNVFEKLLSIIDTTTRKNLIEKRDCPFNIHIMLDTVTGYPIEINIKDNCSILSEKQKEKFKEILFKTQFDFCHEEHDVPDKLAKSLSPGSFGFLTGSFSTWWNIKVLYEEK
ncbi:MAG: hypothetical protein KBA86_00225 [Bacteroidales bacterium]|jgi:hypothetical protein|nr:hypothetical protein [Bacteroidales bacterium]